MICCKKRCSAFSGRPAFCPEKPGFKSLKQINLPFDLTVIGENAFSDCVGLEKVTVPSNVTKIDDLVFNGCTSLSSVELPLGLRKIGKSAFKCLL